MVELYKILLAGRQDDSQRFWVIFAVLNVINGGLFAAVVAQGSIRGVRMMAAIFGVVLCVVWASTQSRMAGWIRWWETKLQEVEPAYLSELKNASSTAEATLVVSRLQIFVDRVAPAGWWAVSTRVIGWLVPLIFGLAWIAMFAMLFLSGTGSADDIRL